MKHICPNSDEEDIVKSFMAFDITPYELVFKVVVGSQIIVPNTIYKKVIFLAFFKKIIVFLKLLGLTLLFSVYLRPGEGGGVGPLV